MTTEEAGALRRTPFLWRLFLLQVRNVAVANVEPIEWRLPPRGEGVDETQHRGRVLLEKILDELKAAPEAPGVSAKRAGQGDDDVGRRVRGVILKVASSTSSSRRQGP